MGGAIAASGVAREDLFVTTKLWNERPGLRRDPGGLRHVASRQLGLDYVDLYLIHWPTPARDRYVDSWRAIERLHAEGRARAIGVSNFQPPHLRALIDETRSSRRSTRSSCTRSSSSGAARLPRAARHRHRGLEPPAQGALLKDLLPGARTPLRICVPRG